MFEQLPLATLALKVRAVGEDRVLGLDGRRSADRALFGRARLGCAPLLFGRVRRGRDDLRDHVAGAQHDDLVALADILAREILLVVQRRHADGHAADADRLELSERVQIAVLADVPVDLLQHSDLRGRRELPRDRPARVAP